MIRPPLPNKRLGELAEILFLAEATRRGYTACKPYGETTPYDWVTYNGMQTFKRVQVKCAFARDHGYGYHINGASQGRLYTPKDVDLIAAYVGPADAWYLIPTGAIVPLTTINLYPHKPKDRWQRFRENWWRLGRLHPTLHTNPAHTAILPPLAKAAPLRVFSAEPHASA